MREEAVSIALHVSIYQLCVSQVRLVVKCMKSFLMDRPVPGHHGSVQQFYARIVNIVVGVLIVLAIDLTCPW